MRVERRVRPGKVTVRDHDPMRPPGYSLLQSAAAGGVDYRRQGARLGILVAGPIMGGPARIADLAGAPTETVEQLGELGVNLGFAVEGSGPRNISGTRPMSGKPITPEVAGEFQLPRPDPAVDARPPPAGPVMRPVPTPVGKDGKPPVIRVRIEPLG